MFVLTKKQLLFDLYIAYEDAIKRKKKRKYVKEFNENKHKNLVKLRDELWNRTYIPGSSSCFIIEHPKKREVFAAQFRDRIVHHLYFNYTHEMFEATFIADSYSCIKGRGTHYGINRLKHHIESESQNYTKKCYILKLDIMGYFMHINRLILLMEAKSSIIKQSSKKNKNNVIYKNVIDIGFVLWLTETIILYNPTKNCIFKTPIESWNGLPDSKSLFKTKEGYGLPIGNLTSQLFSNVYLNILDQYIKRVLKCKHYGRYVDDFFIVSKNKNFLLSIIPLIRTFLKDNLDLELQEGKIKITTSNYGVEFLGVYIKPYRKYVSNECIRRINDTLNNLKKSNDKQHIYQSINSLLGVFSHNIGYLERKELFDKFEFIKLYGNFDKGYKKYTLI